MISEAVLALQQLASVLLGDCAGEVEHQLVAAVMSWSRERQS